MSLRWVRTFLLFLVRGLIFLIVTEAKMPGQGDLCSTKITWLGPRSAWNCRLSRLAESSSRMRSWGTICSSSSCLAWRIGKDHSWRRKEPSGVLWLARGKAKSRLSLELACCVFMKSKLARNFQLVEELYSYSLAWSPSRSLTVKEAFADQTLFAFSVS